MILIFYGFADGRIHLIKLTKIAGVMHEADQRLLFRVTWWLLQLATDVPFITCVINSPSTFTYFFHLSNLDFRNLEF